MKKKLLLFGALSLVGMALASPGNGQAAFAPTKRNTFITDLIHTDTNGYKKRAQELNKQIAEEGMVLLKNREGALPFGDDIHNVTCFGRASIDLQYGGGGSGSGSVSSGITKIDLQKSLTDAGFEVNPEPAKFYKSRAEANRTNGNTNWTGVSQATVGETSRARHENDAAFMASLDGYKDAAIMVLARGGTEGADCKTYDARDHANDPLSDRHYLELSKNEEDLLELIKEQGFKKIVVLINSGNSFECTKLEDDDMIDAVIWMGVPGANGAAAVGEILNGTVNPSGKTVDTWEKDFTLNPTFQNFADNSQTNIDPDTGVEYAQDTMFNADGTPVNSCNTVRKADGTISWANEEHKVVTGGLNGVKASAYVSYEEGVYLDYRYYETVYDDKAAVDKAAADEWYASEEGVNYPFGYGLSYTSFEQSIVSCDAKNTILHKSTEQVHLTVKVKNTGDVAGKDVVQVYWHAPYTQGGIEKASKVLCAFDKTKVLEPGEEEEIKLSFYLQDVANYDFDDKNGNGFKGYELDPGDYKVSIGKSAHEDYDAINTRVMSAGIRYEKDRYTGNTVENRFTDRGFFNCLPGENDIGFDQMTRKNDFEVKASHPTMEDRTLKEDSRVEEFYTHVFNLDDIEHDENFEYMPKAVKKDKAFFEEKGWTQAASNNIADILFTDLIGVPSDDPRWEDFMNQLTYAELDSFTTGGSTHNPAISRLKKPSTSDSDGPSKFSTMWWCGEGTIAATWNVDLAFQEGECIGIEGHQSGMKYGWAGPGLNLHRSPFGGRNFEYYSADPFLSGRMGGRVVGGATDKGLYCFFKHFAVNDQEKNREGVSCFLTEQALREIYLKPFQMVVEEGKSIGIMSSYNRLGLMETAASYPLQTEVLRNEWGFKGSIISDMTHRGNAKINVKSYENINNRILSGNNNQLDSSDYTPDVNAKWDAAGFDGKGCPVYNSAVTGAPEESYSWWYAIRECAKEAIAMCANSGATRVNMYQKADLEFVGAERDRYEAFKDEAMELTIHVPEELSEGGVYNGKAINSATLVIDPDTPLPDGLELDGNVIKGTPTTLVNRFIHVFLELELEGDAAPTYVGRSLELYVRERIADDTPNEKYDTGKASTANPGVIVGLSIGGAVIVAGIAVAIVVILKKKKA